ncbi:WD-40 repeat-containing protein [Planoprotostelium fungivorum]|uniref:WD-40 repeat-containing protein n=1 Tax=Planoprotostelium fungivorum TaxID=1890364 RepID=A0A2P6N5F6_9EUKA|nr:WD-40 repeat-containing protein [Planoprotostelium fungivorum]
MTEAEMDELVFFWLYPGEKEEERTDDKEGDLKSKRQLDVQHKEVESRMAAVRREVQRMRVKIKRRERKRREAEVYMEELRQTVKLNVRGKKFVTTKKTLQKGGRWNILGQYMDRNSRDFAHVLDYLRTGRGDTKDTVVEEIQYFGIERSLVARREQRGDMWAAARCTGTFSSHTDCVLSGKIQQRSDSLQQLGQDKLKCGLLLSGSKDATMKMWTPSGTCIITFSSHSGPISSVTELKDNLVASGSWDKTVKMWTLDGTCTATFSGHTSAVSSIVQLSNGQIASSSWDKTAKIWTLDGTCTATFSGHSGSIYSVVHLSNGLIASGSQHKTVKIWTLDGMCIATFSGHSGPVSAVTELSNGQIASGSWDKTVKIWTLDGTCTATLSGHLGLWAQ